MKRKNSICKTLAKSKPISHSIKYGKKTLKKSLNNLIEKSYKPNSNYITMVTRKNSRLLTQTYNVRKDR